MKQLRIALIHATPLAVAPINDAFIRLWPQAQRMNLLDDSLSADHAQNKGVLTDEMRQRFLELAYYAKRTGADAILFTCSAFGPAIDDVKAAIGIPTLKPNEAMFEQALKLANQNKSQHIELVATFEPSLAPMCDEFKQLAKVHNSTVKLRSLYIPDAMSALGKGDSNTHDRLIAQGAKKIENASIILLAQFSMAAAKAEVERLTSATVLNSPDCAVNSLIDILNVNR
jgi:aspartate/glutamate racemase